MTKFKSLLLTFFFLNICFSQNPDWQTITNMNDVRDIAFYNDKVWAASDGGLFIYDPLDESIEKITNIEGLRSVDLQAVVLDDHNNIIVGSTEGHIQIQYFGSVSWQDIQFDGSDIKDILVVGDTLWVAAAAGVAVFLWRNDEWEYNDFFINFPELVQTINTLIIFENRIWLATDVGLLSAPSDFASNTLTDPQNWTLFKTGNNLPSNNILSLTVYDNKLWIGTDKGLAYYSNNTIQFVNTYGPNPIVDLASNKEDLIVLRTKTYFQYNLTDGIVHQIDFQNEITGVKVDDAGKAWIAVKDKGLRNSVNNTSVRIDGPVNNHARFVFKDTAGRVWISTGKFRLNPREGYSVLENGVWKSIEYNTYRWSDISNTTYIYEDRFNNIWLATWGGGVEVLHNNDYLYFHNYDYSGNRIVTTRDTSILEPLNAIPDEYKNFFVGVPKDPDYEVTTFFKEDFSGNLWITNSEAINKEYLAVAPYTNDFLNLNKSNWQYFGESDGIDGSVGVMAIEFDDFGRVWIGSDRRGLYRLDYNNTLYNKSDDKVKYYDTDDNLYSNSIKTIAKDQDGILWFGSDAGLNSYDGVNMYKHIGDENGVDGPINTTINQIVVDKYNNKWIATAGGISILRAGKSPFEPGAWISYNTKNSGLVDDNVHSIYVDNTTSEALIGTENGISIFKGSFAEIKDNYDEVAAGPNPFILQSENFFIIKKLKDNSTVKIFNLNGKLVRELTASNRLVDGSRATWNGQDSNGNLVASGIYLYLAYTENGSASSGKIAVIRK